MSEKPHCGRQMHIYIMVGQIQDGPDYDEDDGAEPPVLIDGIFAAIVPAHDEEEAAEGLALIAYNNGIRKPFAVRFVMDISEAAGQAVDMIREHNGIPNGDMSLWLAPNDTLGFLN